MQIKNTKVVIVGCGNVGTNTAYSILNQGLCEEIVLIDVNHDKAYAEALDMTHAAYFMNRNVTVRVGDYPDCSDADVVIVTAAAPMPADSNNRLEMLKPSMNVMKSVVSSVMASGFSGIFLVISNPVDIMTYYCWKLSGLPSCQVIGSGTNLDTARLCCEIGEMYHLAPKSVEAFVCGEHGDSELVAWNSATVGGKMLDDVMRDNSSRTKDVTKSALLKRTAQAGWEIFSRKHNTCYGIAASAAAIVKSILYNENQIYPISVYLEGQYGINGAYLSAPTIIDRTGAKEIVEIRLSEDEAAAMKHSAEVLEQFYKELDV